ncbi:MAG: polysaccharide biosynthesis/export family protein, partial [Calditrichota bacterium]
MNPRFKCLCWLLLLILPSLSQTELNRDQNNSSADLRLLLEGGGANFPSPAQRTIAVDEEAYTVNAGDVFMIKIDVPGPATKVFPATVSADGFLLLPDAPSVDVKQKNLKEAKRQIRSTLKRYNRGAKVEVFLYQVREITVSIVGAVNVTQNISLHAGTRLLDALQNVLPSTDPRLNDEENAISISQDPYATAVPDLM